MDTISVHLFKSSFGPVVTLLNEHGIKYSMRQTRMGVPMASGETLEIVKAVLDSKELFGALAAIVVTFIRTRSSRKVIITTKQGATVHVEGLTADEVEKVMEQAQSLMLFDTGKDTVKADTAEK